MAPTNNNNKRPGSSVTENPESKVSRHSTGGEASESEEAVCCQGTSSDTPPISGSSDTEHGADSSSSSASLASRSNQSNTHAAVKQSGTSSWLAYRTTTKVNIIDYLHLEEKFCTMDSILTMLSDLQCCDQSARDWTVLKRIGEVMAFSVDRVDCEKESPYSHYPEGASALKRDMLLTHIHDSLDRVERLRTDMDLSDLRDIDHICAAEHFMEEVLLFLKLQPLAQKGAMKGVFTSFCKIAGLRFRCADYTRERKMQIYDETDIPSKPDLRAYSYRVQSWRDVTRHAMTEDSTRAKCFPALPVLTIAQVKTQEVQVSESDYTERKPTTEEQESKTEQQKRKAYKQVRGVLGQIIGEMLAEMFSKETLSSTEFLGFAVQCTKVQAVVLKMNERLLQFIKNPSKKGCPYNGAKGEVFVTEALDMLNATDRLQLMSFMNKVVNLRKRVTSVLCS